MFRAGHLMPGVHLQGTSLSMQATPQASPLTANGQPSLAEPADPSSPPLVQADSAARSEGGAEEKQDALPNGVHSWPVGSSGSLKQITACVACPTVVAF